jgi:asparagine synthase (glutamine-hydrolysing)
MPGIFGLITKLPREIAESRLRTMLAASSRGPSVEVGTWTDSTLGLYVGWVIKKDCFSEGIPYANERGDTVLIFSGEEYPASSTLGRLKSNGHILGRGPGSYLVHLYEDDPTFPAGLNGRFQGILADTKKGAIKLFNDRYGMHRIYYHESGDAFYFAAEAKTILGAIPALRSPDDQGLGEFVACGCVLENRTIFRDLHVLPPGAAWFFQSGSIAKKTCYFDPKEWEQQGRLDPESYYEQLRAVFSQNLTRYFEGDQSIGMSLTGGLDTRMILAWYKAAPGTLPCYSFGGSYRDCQDVSIARKIASVYGQSHTLIPVGTDFLSRFAEYAERTVNLTDGCASVTHAADLYANERAAEIAPIRMTGNYGGEVLRRVRAFKPTSPAPGLYKGELIAQIGKAYQTYARVLEGHPLSFAVFRQAPWHHYGLLCLEQTQISLRSPYLDNELVKTVFQAPDSVLSSNDISLRLIADGSPRLRAVRTDRGLGGSQGTMSAAATRAFLEFTFKAEYAYDYGMPQWVSRIDHFVSPLKLQRLFLGRHKFYHYRVWYRDALSKYVREILLDSRSLGRPYVERRKVEDIVNGHLKGGLNYTTEIHKLLTLELMHRLFMDRN